MSEQREPGASPTVPGATPWDTDATSASIKTRRIRRVTADELPDPLAPAAQPRTGSTAADHAATPASHPRPHRTWQQVLGGLILAAAAIVAAAWYVPRVIDSDGRLITGSVVSSGVTTLNFPGSGQIARIAVHEGQSVRKGELLATEYAPQINSLLSADVTAVRSEQSKLAAMRSVSDSSTQPGQVAPTPADLSAVRAQIKLDEAQLSADQARGASTRIVAPAAGTILAANGNPGEAVSAQGIRDYAADAPKQAVDETPAFSLLPEGPQTDHRVAAGNSSLPVIALRTSDAWQVSALVPESSVARIRSGERVTVGVPAAHLTAVPGRISELLSTPVSTSQGEEYQAVIAIAGHAPTVPLSGMAANVRLDPPGSPGGRQ